MWRLLVKIPQVHKIYMNHPKLEKKAGMKKRLQYRQPAILSCKSCCVVATRKQGYYPLCRLRHADVICMEHTGQG